MIFTPAAAYAFQFLNFPFRRTLLVVIINAFVLPNSGRGDPVVHAVAADGPDRQHRLGADSLCRLSFAWSIFLVKNFLEDFPKELIEAGAHGRLRPDSTFFHVVLPKCLASIFAVGILQFLFCWNSLLIPLLFLRHDVPLPVIFAQISGQYDPNWDQRAVAAIVTTIVPLIVFLMFQRQFAAGAMTRGGNKE